MKPTSIKLLRTYLFVDMGVILLSLMMGEGWLLNSQLAFLCSLMITSASFYSYQKMVQRRLDAGEIPEDKFEHLYDDALLEEEEERETEDKKAPSSFKMSGKNLVMSYKSALSLYRLGSYALLFVVVLFLIRHESLEAIAFFVGLSVIPLSSLMFSVMSKKGDNETNE